MGKVSPMMQQYLDIKSAHKNHILFFRLGDFYEMFFDDAVTVSKELELTLTGKDCGMPERAPMCGIPYHSADTYIKKLMARGYKVAICEQTEDASKSRGLVNREVTRVITPGTVIEGDLLEDTKNNYIASFYVDDDGKFAICFADISTGDLLLTEQQPNNSVNALLEELSKFMPAEVICNNQFHTYDKVKQFMSFKLQCVYSPFDKEKVDIATSEQVIKQHFGIEDLACLALDQKPYAVYALGGLIQYLNQTQPDGAKRIHDITFYKEDQYMNIDLSARQNLEITQTIRLKEKRGTLLWVLDKTKTAMGKRLMRKAIEQPLLGVSEICSRQNAVQELFDQAITRSELREQLQGIFDLERLMTRVLYGSANPREIRALASTIAKLPVLKKLTASFESETLQSVHHDIDLHPDIQKLINHAVVEDPPVTLKDGGVVKPGFNQTLDELRALCSDAKQVIDRMEQQEREATGIKNLKIKYNRVFGYYLEVTNSYLDLVPETYMRKQTLTGCERYITEELKQLESKILTASEQSIALEHEIFTEVRKYIATQLHTIQRTANAVAQLDFLCSLAFVAVQNQYVCPTVSLDGTIDIQDGRHPVVEQMVCDSLFVPNDVFLDQDDHRTMIITGPNMAGKSTYMRQVAILSIMAQMGSFVPAAHAHISVVDRIFTRVGASDDLASGQSTFMVEMSEVAHILKNATSRSLVILDEIGRGTSTFDGMSIARAVVEYITNHQKLRCKTLFATHYHELTSMEEELEGVKNYNIVVKKRGDEITFLRKIVPGGADDSFGIEVAKLAGVPDKVVERSREILQELEKQNGVVRMVKVQEQPLSSDTQMGFAGYPSEIENRLKLMPVDTLTPIEALNALYELKKLMK